MNAKHIRMIQDEHRKACEKHPKFCDALTGGTADSLGLYEHRIKVINSKGPYYGEFILDEEKVEALHAFVNGEYDHALQELAQCGAVILRMMQYVEETKWAHQGEDKYGT